MLTEMIRAIFHFGNPGLSPELSDQFELTYNTFIKGISFNIALYYRHERDNIESYLSVQEDGTSVNTFENLGENKSVGVNLYTSANIQKKLNLRGGINVGTYDAESTVEGINLSRQSVAYNANLNATLSLKNGFRIQAFGRFNGKRQTLQGFRPSHSFYSIGAVKEFWNKRANLGINISQPFSKNLKFPSELEGDDFFSAQ